MRSRILLYSPIGLSALAVVIFCLSCSTSDREPAQVFPAAVDRDCAPWDGSAFTVSIHYDSGSVIDISIWGSPELHGPIQFSFPDETLRVGDALLLLPAGLPEEMTGEVYFQRVEQGIPVQGEFHLATDAGKKVNGKFAAAWGNEMVYCG